MKSSRLITQTCLAALLFSCQHNDSGKAPAVTETAQFEPRAAAAQQAGDMGKKPWVMNIEEATVNNTNYRDTKWTGEYLQMVLMSVKPGEEIKLEMHPNVDQFIRIEQGEAQVRMGTTESNLNFTETASDDWAIFIPAGYFHHIKNIGNSDLKLYSIYAPKEHTAGTRHKTFKEAQQFQHQH